MGGPIAERIFCHRNGFHRRPLELAEPNEYFALVWETEQEYAPDEAWPDEEAACRALRELDDPPRLRLEARRVSRLLRYPKTWSAVEALAHPLADAGRLSMEEANSILEKMAAPTSKPPSV